MSTQDVLRALASLRVEATELPPKMRNLACAIANCKEPSAVLVNFMALNAAFFEPACSQHGGQVTQVIGFLREAEREVRQQMQREQEELRQWQLGQRQKESEQQQKREQQAAQQLANAESNSSDQASRTCPFQHLHAVGDTTYDSCVQVFDKTREYRDRTWQAARLAANHGMLPGHHYNLTYQEDWPGQWPPKQVGGSWVGEFKGESETHYELSAGPYGGGGSMPKHWVYEILEVPIGHPMFIQRWTGPGR